jgi:hypothetical protein
MNRKTWFGPIFVMVLCLLSSGCFSMEQEIFLEPDGSGDVVAYFSMPNIPDEFVKGGLKPEQTQQNLLEEIKRIFAADLPPSMKLKEVKEVKRPGVLAYYAVLHFNQLDDLNSWLEKIAKARIGEKGPGQFPYFKEESTWKVRLEKTGDLTVVTQHINADFMGALGLDKLAGAMIPSPPPPSDPPPPAEPKALATPKPASRPGARRAASRTARGAKPVQSTAETSFEPIGPPNMNGMNIEEAMGMMLSSIFKMRFTLHAPKKIIETNADIVLNGNIAVWNASFGGTDKEKKPFEMKVTY